MMVGVVIIASIATAAWAIDRLERGVTLTVCTDKARYAYGESVQISIQLKNYGFSPVTLVYSSSLIMSFSIYDSDDQEVFTGPRIGLAVITDVDLEPGGVKRHDYIWNQTNNMGEQVYLPDTFMVRAFSESYERIFYADATFSIRQDYYILGVSVFAPMAFSQPIEYRSVAGRI